MRIISGKYKGKTIRMPRGIRPTQDKVRKALFDILADIEDVSFLELFAGSGAVGLEALSFGAKSVVFVENNPACLKILESNLNGLSSAAYDLLPMDALSAIKKLAQGKANFDIIFLDPPYFKEATPVAMRPGLSDSQASRLLRDVPPSAAKKTLQMLGVYDILAPNGFIIVQHFKKDNLPERAGDLMLFKQSRYGDSVLSFYRKHVPDSHISR
ncbi:MAG: RsmD family RNA methyltransferase [Candidatus Omnitrophota bacterium]